MDVRLDNLRLTIRSSHRKTHKPVYILSRIAGCQVGCLNRNPSLHNKLLKVFPSEDFQVFLDDYQNLRECKRAVDEYREENNISDPIINIDSRAVYWIKSDQ